MAPPKESEPNPAGLSFEGVRAFFVEVGMQGRRLEVWKHKLQQLGAILDDHLSQKTTHVFALTIEKLQENIGLKRFRKLKVNPLRYEWIEDSLKAGVALATDQYLLEAESSGKPRSSLLQSPTKDETFNKKGRLSSPILQRRNLGLVEDLNHEGKKDFNWLGAEVKEKPEASTSEKMTQESVEYCKSVSYIPPDLNRMITEPFGEIQAIYKDALGDDRRSFSYTKAISVLEKLPFKITNVDQVKDLPSIGKSLQDQIHEILMTGKLSRLENFKQDEKVCTIKLFGSIWGIGPVTAQKLYDRGHRTLEDLSNELSLTTAQRVGLKFHDDIIKKIPRHEVKTMLDLVRSSVEEIQSGMVVVCGGSYRRGKAFCGDMDIIMTHPDGLSHKGFLQKLVAFLKERDFLTEDLLFGSSNSTEGMDPGIDTYYGLCKYPGREQRHRVDFKVYPLERYPFGLIAWTGNDVLNRRLRLAADAKGYKLDDKGLYPATQDSPGHKVAQRSLSMPFKTEMEVFEFLAFPWLEPHERNL